MDNYRIYRTDPNNIAIQRKAGEHGQRWETISYHGHSVKSLTRGLFTLIMSQHTPGKENVLEALLDVELALVSGTEKVEKMIKEWTENESR